MSLSLFPNEGLTEYLLELDSFPASTSISLIEIGSEKSAEGKGEEMPVLI